MSESKFHRIKVCNRSGAEDQITTGFNTQIFIDGILLKGVKSIKIEVATGEVAKVTIEMVGIVDLEVNSELDEPKVLPFITSLEKLKNSDDIVDMYPYDTFEK